MARDFYETTEMVREKVIDQFNEFESMRRLDAEEIAYYTIKGKMVSAILKTYDLDIRKEVLEIRKTEMSNEIERKARQIGSDNANQ